MVGYSLCISKVFKLLIVEYSLGFIKILTRTFKVGYLLGIINKNLKLLIVGYSLDIQLVTHHILRGVYSWWHTTYYGGYTVGDTPHITGGIQSVTHHILRGGIQLVTHHILWVLYSWWHMTISGAGIAQLVTLSLLNPENLLNIKPNRIRSK